MRCRPTRVPTSVAVGPVVVACSDPKASFYRLCVSWVGVFSIGFWWCVFSRGEREVEEEEGTHRRGEKEGELKRGSIPCGGEGVKAAANTAATHERCANTVAKTKSSAEFSVAELEAMCAGG